MTDFIALVFFADALLKRRSRFFRCFDALLFANPFFADPFATREGFAALLAYDKRKTVFAPAP